MISDQVRTGFDKAPHRSLFRTLGLTDKELSRPLIAVVSAKSDIIPGHMHLDQIAEAVKAGVYAAGGSSSEHQRIYHGGTAGKASWLSKTAGQCDSHRNRYAEFRTGNLSGSYQFCISADGRNPRSDEKHEERDGNQHRTAKR